MKVLWKHDVPARPTWLYAELDEDRWEQRKVELFADGRIGYADGDEEYGGTILAAEAWPTLKEIADDPEFFPEVIDRAEFEELWNRRRAK